jgi:hypothetical protein
MRDEFSCRLAQEILAIYGDLQSFEIDFVDEQTTIAVSQHLVRMGCVVERLPFKSALRVTCPVAESYGQIQVEEPDACTMKTPR